MDDMSRDNLSIVLGQGKRTRDVTMCTCTTRQQGLGDIKVGERMMPLIMVFP
jgi:hypothetical protein